MFKNLEKQTYLIFFKDGIIELLFGCIFIIYAANTWFDMENLFRPFWLRVLIIPIAIALALVKEFVTKKRIGKVSFTKKRRQRSIWMFAILITAQIVTLIAYLLATTGKPGIEQKTSLIGLTVEFMFLILVFYALTWVTGYNSFLMAGLVFAFSTPFLILMNPDLHHSSIRIGIMIIAGFSFLIFGIIRLAGFLKKYPEAHSYE